MFTSEQYAEKIAALLRKAESTTPEEAELFTSKAQELMSMYAIDQSMVESSRRGQVDSDRIVHETIEYHSIYSRAIYNIGSVIAKHNHCEPLITRGKDLMLTNLHVIGFERDVERVKFLNASLQIQAMRALDRWWGNQDTSNLRTREKFKVRRQFLLGFSQGLSAKLTEAKRAGERAAEHNEAERSGTSLEDAARSVSLVMRSKEERVQDWIAGNLAVGKGRRTRYAHGGSEASEAGRAAGLSASIGEPAQVSSSRKGLTR